LIISRNNNILLVSLADLPKMSVVMVLGKIILATMGLFSKKWTSNLSKSNTDQQESGAEYVMYQQPISYCDVSKSTIKKTTVE